MESTVAVFFSMYLQHFVKNELLEARERLKLDSVTFITCFKIDTKTTFMKDLVFLLEHFARIGTVGYKYPKLNHK